MVGGCGRAQTFWRRLRGEGLPKKRIAGQLGLDPKTVRRYLTAAAECRRPRDGRHQYQ